MVGTMVVAGQTHGAMSLPCGSPTLHQDIADGTDRLTLATPCTCRADLKLTVAHQSLAEVTTYHVGLEPRKTAGYKLKDACVALHDILGYALQGMGDARQFGIAHLCAVYVEPWETNIGIGHLQREPSR